MSKIVKIQFAVPAGYVPGDWANLHTNGGAGDIDWDTPATNERFELFPGGGGMYGFGHTPFGHSPFGHGLSVRCPGFGHLPFGHYPFGHGTAVILARYPVSDCGDWKFGFKVYDALGNPHTGSPGLAELTVHVAPASPAGLKKNSYNSETNVLTLDVA